jgi:hypothetical protein
MTAVDMPVTRRKGDILQMGVDVRQHYGETVAVALYCKRLVCLNGMMVNERAFEWTQRQTGTVDHQIAWLRTAIAGALEAYETLVARAKQMAETPIHGDPHNILREHARAMRLPERRLPALLEAFDAEPDPTSWGLLNAFTRLATHGGLPQRLSRSLMQASGQWVHDFDLVTCRLPRPMAIAVGAEITEA